MRPPQFQLTEAELEDIFVAPQPVSSPPVSSCGPALQAAHIGGIRSTDSTVPPSTQRGPCA